MHSQTSATVPAPPVDVGWEHNGFPNGNQLLSYPRIPSWLKQRAANILIFSVLSITLCASHAVSQLFLPFKQQPKVKNGAGLAPSLSACRWA